MGSKDKPNRIFKLMKPNQNQKSNLRKKIIRQKNWNLLAKTYQGSVRDSYIALKDSILDHLDKWGKVKE